jgi:hypothetical protein
MASTSNYGWTTPNDSDPFKLGASAIRALGSAIDTSMNAALGTKPAQGVLLNTTSFSAFNTIQVSSVFSGTYNNYLAVFDFTNTSGAGNHQLQLTNGGTPSGNFTTVGWQMSVSGGTGSATNLGNGQQNVNSSPVCNSTTGGAGGYYVYFFNPAIANSTVLAFSGAVHSQNSALTANSGNAIHFSSTAFDGFRIVYGGTNLTGTVRTYGLRNS